MNKDEYQQYLRSDHWLERREEAKKDANHQCDACGAKDYLEVHHLSYANLWREEKEDLQVLCRACHHREHSEYKMPFGKYMNQFISEVPTDYLQWAIDNSWRESVREQCAWEIIRRRLCLPRGMVY